MNRLHAWLHRIQATKPWRAWQRYGEVRGNVLAGGVAYFALFSIFPLLALAFTAFGLVLGESADLQQRVADYINDIFGMVVIGTSPGEGVLTIDQLVQGDVLTVWGLLGVIVLLFTGLGWMGAMRDGVSAVFGQAAPPNIVAAKLADLAMMVVLGLTVLASVVGSVLITATTGPVLDWLGLGRSQIAQTGVGVLTALVLLSIDTALFLLMFRVLSGVRPAFRAILPGALAGGIGLGVLKLGSGVLLRMASGNRFLAAFYIILGLLIWMNLAARLTLLAASWAAVTVDDRSATSGAEVTSSSRPAPSAPTLTPTYSARAADRTTLLAGAVLGATAAVGARALHQVGRTLRGTFRRSSA